MGSFNPAVIILPEGGSSWYEALSLREQFSSWASNNCICLRGTCSAIEKTLFRRRTAAMYVSLEGRIIMIRPTFPVPSVQVGDTVAIYLSRHFPVFERDEVQVITRYYALSVTSDLSVVEEQHA